MLRFAFGACLVSLIASAAVNAAETDPAVLRGRAIKAHTAFLASDLLGGREAGSKGYEIAAAYVASQFEAFGLEPAGDDGSYFQAVPLRRRSLEPDGVQFTLRMRGREMTLENGVDIAVDASPYVTEEVLEAELVFVGWGITAPSLGFDDYAGLDVEGKAVVLIEGAPATFPGALRAHYSWTKEKERMAAAHGAIAVITLKSPTRERFSPFELARQIRPMPSLAWTDPKAAAAQARPRATITLSPELARKLFARVGRNIEEIYRYADAKPPRGFELPMTMRMLRKSRHEDTTSPNVLGVLPGTDPDLRDEYVVVAAHLDAFVGKPPNGDSIYNGAVDNAGGVATMLEVARAIQASGGARRSILFFATTAEEKGLIGSDYFVEHPTVPLEKMVAAISVDGLMAFHDFAGIVSLGSEHSTLGEISLAAARAIGAVHVPDPIPERGNLALSDQYPFLRMGIPVLFPNPARGTTRAGTEDVADWDTYESRHYHQPSDDMHLPLRWDVAGRWGQYIEAVVRGMADAPTRPLWYEGDKLAEVFAPDAPRAPSPARASHLSGAAGPVSNSR
ncbi:MAG TPA: M28 family metallopeptidase [Steroidobacter sp.]